MLVLWPIIVVILIVFLISFFTVQTAQMAVITRFGKIPARGPAGPELEMAVHRPRRRPVSTLHQCLPADGLSRLGAERTLVRKHRLRAGITRQAMRLRVAS
jgi:hypothetical protein